METFFDICTINDEAIDLDATTPAMLEEFKRSPDMSKLVFRKGAEPCVYRLKRISHLHMRWVKGAIAEYDLAVRAFQCSLDTVLNMRQEDGTAVPSWQPPRDATGAIKDEALQRFDYDALGEIGLVAYDKSFFRRMTTRVSGLPHSSVVLLDARIALHAAASRSSPAPSSEPASST